MKKWTLVGWLWLGLMVVACGGGGDEAEPLANTPEPSAVAEVAEPLIQNTDEPQPIKTVARATAEGGEMADTPATKPPVSNVESERTPKGLSGLYNVTGTNPDGSPYEGTLNITPQDSAYRLYWEAGNSFEGMGLLNDDVFSVGWGSPTCTIIAYRKLADGTLDGEWVVVGQQGIGTEVAVPRDVPAGDILGTYDVTGTNPGGGQPYAGELVVTGDNNTYRFTWNAGGFFEGQGIMTGNVVSVGWGPQQRCSTVSYTIAADGSLSGIWGIFEQPGLGTEAAIPAS